MRAAVPAALLEGAERETAARPVDLLRKLNENEPHVVHFSSHGNADELILESEEEDAGPAGPGGASARSAEERDMKKAQSDEPEAGRGQICRALSVGKSALASVLRSCDSAPGELGSQDLRSCALAACNAKQRVPALAYHKRAAAADHSVIPG